MQQRMQRLLCELELEDVRALTGALGLQAEQRWQLQAKSSEQSKKAVSQHC
jgi:hypothetical protein